MSQGTSRASHRPKAQTVRTRRSRRQTAEASSELGSDLVSSDATDTDSASYAPEEEKEQPGLHGTHGYLATFIPVASSDVISQGLTSSPGHGSHLGAAQSFAIASYGTQPASVTWTSLYEQAHPERTPWNSQSSCQVPYTASAMSTAYQQPAGKAAVSSFASHALGLAAGIPAPLSSLPCLGAPAQSMSMMCGQVQQPSARLPASAAWSSPICDSVMRTCNSVQDVPANPQGPLKGNIDWTSERDMPNVNSNLCSMAYSMHAAAPIAPLAATLKPLSSPENHHVSNSSSSNSIGMSMFDMSDDDSLDSLISRFEQPPPLFMGEPSDMPDVLDALEVSRKVAPKMDLDEVWVSCQPRCPSLP